MILAFTKFNVSVYSTKYCRVILTAIGYPMGMNHVRPLASSESFKMNVSSKKLSTFFNPLSFVINCQLAIHNHFYDQIVRAFTLAMCLS